MFVLYLSVSWCLPWFALVFTPYGLLDSSLKSVTTFLRIIRTYGKSWHTKVFYYYYLKNKVEKAFLIQIFPSLWYDCKGVLIVLYPDRFLNLKCVINILNISKASDFKVSMYSASLIFDRCVDLKQSECQKIWIGTLFSNVKIRLI